MDCNIRGMERNLCIVLCALYFACLLQRCDGKPCPEDGASCPQECCMETGTQAPCCQSHRPIYEIDERQVMAVGLTVICSCVVLTVTVVICCFWSRCPLYNTCRVNYTQGHIIAYPKEDDPLNSIMPPDEGQNNYSPNAVKIKPVEDV
ncbi:uncharacterized protein [Periplaneta americana]|uniref:uncharacterized protein n=1 Tax=Periplaneta americana TaxID=6978 RepID=UPI0037E8530B